MPEVGKPKLVPPDTVNERALLPTVVNAPPKVRLPPRSIVRAASLTLIVRVRPADRFSVLANVKSKAPDPVDRIPKLVIAVWVPPVIVGEVPPSNAPDPDSSEIAAKIPAEVGAAVTAEVPLPINTPVNVAAPVPPRATANVPAQVSVCVVPLLTIVTFVSLTNVCAEPVRPFKSVMPEPEPEV